MGRGKTGNADEVPLTQNKADDRLSVATWQLPCVWQTSTECLIIAREYTLRPLIVAQANQSTLPTMRYIFPVIAYELNHIFIIMERVNRVSSINPHDY